MVLGLAGAVRNVTPKVLGAAAAALLLTSAASAQVMPGDTVPVQWNESAISNIIAAKPAPTVAARALAEVATAMYDAWAAYDTLAVPTQSGNGNVRQTGSAVTTAAKAQAISYAAYRTLLDLFPANTAPAAAAMAALGYDPANTVQDSSPAGIGNRAAAAVIAFRHNDGSNQLGNLNGGAPYTDYSGYTMPNTPYVINDPNAWQPLAITVGGVTSVQKFATPFWGAVIPFNPMPPFMGTGPSRYPSAAYTADAQSILATSAALNDTTKSIAEYWADFAGTQLPPGHWSRIGEYVSRRDLHSLDTDVQMFFALNNALLDAGISAWAVKRTFNSERPITAVHYLYTGQQVYAWAGPGKGAQWIDGGTWLPYQPANVVTPPFAEYTSGHSTFSFAATAVLQYFTGSDSFGASVIIPAGSSTVEPGITPAQPVTLYFSTFTSAASQAGLSRRYGGIHYVAGDLGGRADGFNIGQSDWTQAVTYFNGGTPCNVKTNGNGNSYGRYKKQSSYCSSLANDWLSYSYSAINGLGSYGSTGGGGTPNTSGGGSGNGGSGNGGSGNGGSGGGDDGHGDDGHGGDMSGGDSQGTHDDHEGGGWSSAGGLDN